MEHLQYAVSVPLARYVKESVAYHRDKFGFDRQGRVDGPYEESKAVGAMHPVIDKPRGPGEFSAQGKLLCFGQHL